MSKPQIKNQVHNYLLIVYINLENNSLVSNENIELFCPELIDVWWLLILDESKIIAITKWSPFNNKENKVCISFKIENQAKIRFLVLSSYVLDCDVSYRLKI